MISALATWIAWAAIDPLPLVEDEISYVLQSRIFATGRWTAPTPPAPDFFQQAHVLTVPAVASKYPPGHALLMSIGSLFGAPVLVPLLLTSLTGALLFFLVTQVSSEKVAWLAWLAWLGDPINLRFRAAYYSEVTTSLMWLIVWWALLEWRKTRSTRWLLAIAAAMGWGAITRPFTMLAFAVPVGVVVIRDVVRLRLWRDFAGAFALGTLFVALLPVWSAKTTGDWRLTPQALYTREFLPYDKPGFGVDTTRPKQQLTPPNAFTYQGFYPEHATHTPGNLPRIAFDRLATIARQEWAGPRIALVPFIIIGLTVMSAEVTFALACSLALFVGYLSYGHWKEWTLYYFEATPILSVLAALGIWRSVEWIRGRIPRASLTPTFALASLLLVASAAHEVVKARARTRRAATWTVAFEQLLASTPFKSAVVFVHYNPKQATHATVVANSPDLAGERFWIVNDLGARNHELMQHAAGRVPLAFYEETGTLVVDRDLRH